MQKRIFIFLFFLFTFLSYSTFAEAALQFLPRYQGGYGVRSQEGGKDKVTVTCASRGGVEKGANQTCTGAFTAGDKTCYKSCACNNGYKVNALGGCVAKACADYGLKSSPDITQNCSQVSKAPSLTCFECIACDTSVYKYNCSGTGYAAAQSGMACNKLYSECKCAANYRWDKASGKCICDGDYTVDDNGVCNLKVCEDYNLSASEDTAKDCIQSSPRSGLSCWACVECDSSYQYECLSVSNAGGGDGESCGGRYKKCSCDSLYKWEDGSCVLGCTRNSCSASDFPLSSRSAVNAVSYEECTPSCSDESPRYKVSACASGYDVKPNGSGCEEKPSTCAQYGSGNIWKWYCCKEGKNYVAEIDFASSDVQSSRMKPQTFNSTYASVCPSGYRLPTPCELGYAKYVMGISALNNKLSLEGKSPLKTSDSYSSSQGIWYYTSGVDKNYPSRHIAMATDRSGEAAPSGNTSSYVDVYGSYIRCVKDRSAEPSCAQYGSGNIWKWYCCKEGKNYVAEIDFASSDVQSSRMKPQTFNSTYASVCPSGYRLPTPCELGYAKYVMGISALNNKLSLEGKSPLKTSDSYSSSQGIWYYTSGVDKNYPSRHIVTATDRSGEAAPSGNTSSYVDVYGSYIRCVKDN